MNNADDLREILKRVILQKLFRILLRRGHVSCVLHLEPVALTTFGNLMAIPHKHANVLVKAVKQNAHNSSQRSTLRTAIKAVRKAIEAGDKAAAALIFQTPCPRSIVLLTKIIHKNKAARHKSVWHLRSKHWLNPEFCWRLAEVSRKRKRSFGPWWS